MLTLYQVCNCFCKLSEINIFPSHSNQPSSLTSELINRFLYKGKIGFNLIKIQLCEAKMSLMRVGLMMPATSKMEIFVIIVEEQKLSKTVINSAILEAIVVLDSVESFCNRHSSFTQQLKSSSKWPQIYYSSATEK